MSGWSYTCVYSSGAAFCSERKLSSLLNHDVLRLVFEVQTCPVSAAACPGTLKVALHVCQSVSNKAAGVWAAEERSETLPQPTQLWAQLAGCKASGGSSFLWLQACVSGEPGIMTVCYKKKKKSKKDSLFNQETALKKSLLVTAPRCSNLFSEHTLTLDMCVSPDIHKHTLHLLFTHSRVQDFRSWKETRELRCNCFTFSSSNKNPSVTHFTAITCTLLSVLV